ncbi:MAG: Flp pilus assembly protein CpaB [Myxococcaceae bacterium]
MLVALGLGLLTAIAAAVAWRSTKQELRRGWELIPVVVAAQDLPEGTEVTAQMVAERSVPEQFVTSSVIRPEQTSYVINQRVLVPVQKGDPLAWTHFGTGQPSDRLSGKVQKKARVVTIDAGRSQAVGGWVRPNDHVDVIGTFRDPQSNEQVAVTLLQNVIVVATGRQTGTSPPGESQRDYSNVSLLVIPEEAEVLVLAQQEGKLTLSLRNETDPDLLEERGRATLHTLFSGERTREYQKKRAGIVDVIRGGAGP